MTSDYEPLPIINADLCVGCHACVDACPTNALAQIDDKAFLALPQECTYCSACQDLCPESAIALPFMIIFKKG